MKPHAKGSSALQTAQSNGGVRKRIDHEAWPEKAADANAGVAVAQRWPTCGLVMLTSIYQCNCMHVYYSQAAERCIAELEPAVGVAWVHQAKQCVVSALQV